MSPATREKLILIFFPSILVGLLWWGWFRPTKRLGANESSAAAARAAMPSPEALMQEQIKLAALSDELEALETKKGHYLQRWERLRGELSHRENRPQALESLAAVFRAHGLTILHEQPGAGHSDAKIQGLEDLHRKLNQPLETTFVELKGTGEKSPPAAAPVKTEPRAVWEIEFVGAYENVRGALDQLVNRDGELLALSLRMAPIDATLKLRRWTLVISL